MTRHRRRISRRRGQLSYDPQQTPYDCPPVYQGGHLPRCVSDFGTSWFASRVDVVELGRGVCVLLTSWGLRHNGPYIDCTRKGVTKRKLLLMNSL